MTNEKKAQGTSLERGIRLIIKLLNSRTRIPFEIFTEDEWGSYSNHMKFLKAINDTWSLHSGNPLFEEVDEDGRPWERSRQRYLRLSDASLRGATAANLAIMPVFLQFLKMLKGTYLERDFASLYGDSARQLKDGERAFLKSTQKKFYYAAKGLKDYSRHSARIETLYNAILREKLIEVRRSKRDKTKVTSTLAPLTVVLFNNGLYLVALDVERQDGAPLKFRIESFDTVKELAKGFKYPADYSPDLFLKDAFGLHHENGVEHVVELELLDPAIVDYVKGRRWSGCDEYFENAAGVPCLRFKTSSLVEVTSWVLGFGPSVRVAGPAKLRTEVAERAERLHQLYAGKPTRRTA